MKRTVLSLFVSAMLPVAVFAQPKLCGNVVNATGWTGNRYTDPYGIYSFDASDNSLRLKTEAKSRYMIGTGGGVADDENLYLYEVEMEDDYASGSIYKMTKAGYDDTRYGAIGSIYDVPTALTWDASTKTFYGCFYNYYGDGYEFGVLTLNNGRASRNKISKLKERIVALADNDNGTLYAIGKSGKLYTVDTATGSLTEVGSTGVKPSELIQSACYEDGSIYWAAQTADKKSILYKVDPTTASASLVGNFPKNEQFSCLYKFKAAAEDGAPAAIEDVTANIEGASLSGTLSFDLPTKTFAGGELCGELAWTVIKDGETIATGKGNPGDRVTTDALEFENDMNYIEVYTENAAGKSLTCKTAFFAGPDTPSSIGWEQAKLTVDGDRNATVTWPAVTTGVNGGYFVPEDVTYKIVRMPDNEVVADKYTGTTFTEQLPEKGGIVSYYYSVSAQFMGKEGYPSETNKVNVGSGYEVPFEEQFDEGALDYWTVLDQNNDYCTWWQNNGSVYSQSGYYDGSDDWLISPSIHMQPDKYYKVAFKYWGGMPGYEDDYNGQAFEVGFGKGTAPASFQILGKKQDVTISEDDAKEFSAVVKVDEDGRYNFGIHDISPADAYVLYVDSFTVTEGGTLQVPAPISDLTATADTDGALQVTLSFTAPTLTAEGKPLESISKIEIKRDGHGVIKVFENPTPGEKLSFTDTNLTGLSDGMHRYIVTSTNDKGESLEAETSVKVGITAPGSVSDVVAEEQADGIHLSWKAPKKDVNGNPIDASGITYEVIAVKYYTNEQTTVATGVKGTTYTDTSFDLNGEQYQVYYVVKATNRAGSGAEIVSNQIVIGKPYELPMTEGFSPEYERQSKYLWWLDITQDINTFAFFRFDTGMSSDNDNGCADFYGAEGAFCNLRSGKINMQGAGKPEMTYDFFVSDQLSLFATLDIEYSTDLKNWTSIDRLDYESLDDPDGEEWLSHTVDLTALAAYPYVYIRLHGELHDDDSAILVDNIRIQDASATGIDSIRQSALSGTKSGVYDLGGKLVTNDGSASSLRSLKSGIYVIGGRKVLVNK